MTVGHEKAEPVSAALAAEAEAWMAADPDPSTRTELAALLEAGDGAEVRARFEHPLMFGTAGLRGALGAGPARMNRLVVRRTTAGVAQWVLDQGAEAARRGIVVGRDARHGSDEFAGDVATIAAAAGLRVRVVSRPLPTPVTAFAVKHFGAAAGVMITASHNPASDNGYKLYMADGAQVIPPDDSCISEAVRIVAARTTDSPTTSMTSPGRVAAPPVELIDEAELLGAYRRAAFSLLDPAGARRLRIVYTPLHGVGGEVLPSLLEEAGFGPVSVVAAQAAPDPDFPTVPFPNPEEPGALDLALADATRLGADLVLANDPDADRLAVAVPDPTSGAWRVLTGDELGVLLADHVLSSTIGADRLVATTIVSSTMLSAMAEAAGVAYVETLTGFKWIARAALRRPGFRLAELAARAKAQGTSVVGRLDCLASRFGVHLTAQWSLRLAGPTAQDEMAEIVSRWRRDPPAALAGLAVTELVDLSDGNGELPPTDALVLRLEQGARVVLRPSGTEPKLKGYFEVVTGPVPLGRLAEARRRADRLLRPLKDEVAARCQSIKGSSASEP